jgi:hypothetical protein
VDQFSRLKRNEYMRGWKKRNKERVNAINVQTRERNRPKYNNINKVSLRKKRYEFYEKTLLGYAKRSAARKGIPFDLEISDIKIPETCPVLGIAIAKPAMSTKRPDNKPSIDRIDNSKGYVKGNIAIVSWRANRLKCDGSIAEFEAILNYMKYHQG